MNAVLILAVLGGLLAVLSLVPQLDGRLGTLGLILVAIGVGLLACGIK